jgi:hypothetical protein
MTAWLALGGGFLLAVIWMDLMFDVQALRAPRGKDLPEPALASIATYYRRVTTDAWPMDQLVGVVMAGTIVATVIALVRGALPLGWGLVALALTGVPIGLALRRVFPNAKRLGTRSDPADVQSRLAREIAVAHVACFAAMLAFVAVALFAR